MAEFDAKAHTGSVKAYKLVDGAFKKDPEFELGELTQASRADTPQRQSHHQRGFGGHAADQDTLAADTPVALGPFAPHWMPMRRQVVGKNWSTMRAAAATGDLRNQLTNVLGPIVNAAPGCNVARSCGSPMDLPRGWASYRQFLLARSKASSQSLLWVSSNDSMLHAFNAKTGAPVMSYLPSPLMGAAQQ